MFIEVHPWSFFPVPGLTPERFLRCSKSYFHWGYKKSISVPDFGSPVRCSTGLKEWEWVSVKMVNGVYGELAKTSFGV